jgi:hypothetical protein
VQDRPLEAWWGRIPFVVCAESWFDSRDDEATAFGSAHYRSTVIPDEERIIARDRAWSTPVTGVDLLRDGERRALRVLSFGGRPEALAAATTVARAEVLHLHRPPPAVAEPVVLSAWTDDEAVAAGLADRLGGLAFVATPFAVLAPGPGW